MKNITHAISLLSLIAFIGLTGCSSAPPKLATVNKNAVEKPINSDEWVEYAKKKETE